MITDILPMTKKYLALMSLKRQ